MHRTLTRIAAVGTAVLLTTVLQPMGTAAAETSNSCNPATSVRLLTLPFLGSEDNRLWVDSPTPTRLVVCFDIPFGNVGGGAIVVDATAGGTAPTVTPGNNPAACPFVLLNPSDPLAFRLAVNVATATVCFTIAGETTTLTFDAGSVSLPPTLEIWRDGTFDWIDTAACPVEYVLWQLGAGPDTCMVTNSRIL